MEAIVANELAKIYPNGVWGAINVSFVTSSRSITVLLGPNGAGKTTTVRMLATLLKPTKGYGLILGYDILRDVWEVRKRIALCPQDVSVDINWTPWEAVKGFLMARGWGISNAEREAMRWLEELELWDVRKRLVAHLSGGQRKRVAVAMVLATNADVLFLDEPTSGLDVAGKYKVWKALRTTIKSGSTILLTTHDMGEAEIISDKVVFVSKGVVVAEGKVESLISKVPYTYKVIVKNTKNRIKHSEDDRILDLGDRLIIYAKSKEEALALASEINAETISISKVSLEDAYLYLTKRGE